MPRFEVLIQPEKNGSLRTETISADSPDELEEILLERRQPMVSYRVLDLPPVTDPLVKKKVKLRDLLMFYRRMEVNIRTGAGLTGALESAAQTTQSPALAAILRYARDRIDGDGATFSDAISRYPRVFSGVALGLIRAGETGGTIHQAMAQLRLITRRNYDTARKLKKMTRYPMIVLSVAVLGCTIILWKAVPQIKNFYAGFGATLPSATQFLIDLSSLITSYPILALGILGGLLFGAFKLPRFLYSIPALHGPILRLPLIGPFMRQLTQANFTRTYAQLVDGNIPILRTLRLCRELDPNVHYRGALSRAIILVSEGTKLADALSADEDTFSPLVVRTIRASESGGEPAKLFEEVVEVQEEDLDDAIERLDELSKPIITMVLGAIVAFVLIALFMPLFNMANVVR